MVCGRGIKGKRAFIQALAGWKQKRDEQSGAPHGTPMDCPQNNVCPPVGDGGIARVSREQVSDVGSLCMWNLGFGERITGKSWVRE